MTTLARSVAVAAVDTACTGKARGPRGVFLAAAAVIVGVTVGLAFSELAQTQFVHRFADFVIARLSADLASLDGRWQRGRTSTTAHRDLVQGTVRCVIGDNPLWLSREMADRIKAGQQVLAQCRQILID